MRFGCWISRYSCACWEWPKYFSFSLSLWFSRGIWFPISMSIMQLWIFTFAHYIVHKITFSCTKHRFVVPLEKSHARYAHRRFAVTVQSSRLHCIQLRKAEHRELFALSTLFPERATSSYIYYTHRNHTYIYNSIYIDESSTNAGTTLAVLALARDIIYTRGCGCNIDYILQPALSSSSFSRLYTYIYMYRRASLSQLLKYVRGRDDESW